MKSCSKALPCSFSKNNCNSLIFIVDDQSAWWYYRFIVEWLSTMLKSPDHLLALIHILNKESEIIRELIEAEEGKCKWGLIALHMTQSILFSVHELKSSDIAESKSCIEKLSLLDPDRSQRYMNILTQEK